MDEKLNFSLPEKKQKTSLLPKICVVLLLVLVGIAVVDLLKPDRQSSPSKTTASSLSEEEAKELAARLSRRNLYTAAARVWQDYLSVAGVTDTEQAKTLFQIGTLLEKSGKYDEAIEYYYRSEITTKLPELETKINTHIKDCFEKLGNFSALRYELMDRTSLKTQDKAGGKIVAEIDAEKITEADLDAIVESTVDNQLAPMTAFMTTEQLYEQKKRALEQYKTSSAKQEFLQSWIAQEVLYRQALEEGFSEQPQIKSVIADMVRNVLSQQLMSKELADKINITESDLMTYYQANKTKYTEPANEEDPNSVERQKSFDEVKQQVMTELAGQKSQDVQQQLIRQLMDKYNVIIHSSAWIPTDANEK